MTRQSEAEMIDALIGSVPRLLLAVRVRLVEPSSAGFVSGGAPSFELVSIAALSLLQDLRRESSYHEQTIRELPALKCRVYRPARDLVQSLRGFSHALRACDEARLSAPELTNARRALGVWVRRAALVLHDARAPYRLLGPDGHPVICPVVEQSEEGAHQCTSELLVHRDNVTGVPHVIRCRVNATHEWANGPGWMRLGALLGVMA